APTKVPDRMCAHAARGCACCQTCLFSTAAAGLRSCTVAAVVPGAAWPDCAREGPRLRQPSSSRRAGGPEGPPLRGAPLTQDLVECDADARRQIERAHAGRFDGHREKATTVAVVQFGRQASCFASEHEHDIWMLAQR